MKKKAIKYLDSHFVGNVEGKTVVITGGNSGIGLEAARECAYKGMNVILAVRSLERGQIALDDIKKDFPQSNISLMRLDLSEEHSIKEFANEIIKDKIDIDVFYHNAGIFRQPFSLKEGKDIVTSTNYFGPFLLTSLLLPYLKALPHEVKMIITGSVAIRWAKLKLDSLYPNPKPSRMTRYSNSKLLDSYLFKYLFDNDKENIKYYLVHPGVCYTPLFKKTYKGLFGIIVDRFMKIFANPAWKSALAAMAAISKDAIEGEFYGPTCFFNAVGYPHKNKFMNRYYKDVDSYIKESEKILNKKLIA